MISLLVHVLHSGVNSEWKRRGCACVPENSIICDSHFGKKRRGKKHYSFFSPLTQLFNLLLTLDPFQAHSLSSWIQRTVLISLSPLEKGRSCLSPTDLRVWWSKERENRGDRHGEGNRNRNKEYSFRSLSEMQPSSFSLYPLYEIILALIPLLFLFLCSVTHKYVTHALKGISSHFFSCLTRTRRRNCLESSAYQTDF